MDVSHVAIFILVEVICFPVPKEKTSGQTQINLRIIFKYWVWSSEFLFSQCLLFNYHRTFALV